MKLNCKPGDMAIVVSAYHRPENIGRIVEVVRVAVEGVDYKINGASQFAWLVKSQRPLARAGYYMPIPDGYEAVCADCNLRPVSGLPVDEEIRDEVAA